MNLLLPRVTARDFLTGWKLKGFSPLKLRGFCFKQIYRLKFKYLSYNLIVKLRCAQLKSVINEQTQAQAMETDRLREAVVFAGFIVVQV